MINIRLDRRSRIIIAVSAVILMLGFGFFAYRSVIKNSDNSDTGGSNSDGISASQAAAHEGSASNIKRNGVTVLGGAQLSTTKPGTAPGSKKVTYTNAQVTDVLTLLLGPLPRNYSESVNGTEIKNGVEYYKVNVVNDKNSTRTYYVLPWEGTAYLLDPQNNSLVQVVSAR